LKKIACVLLSLILIPNIVFARNVLTRDNFIKAAIQNNPRYQISAQEYLIALNSDRSARSLEDWNLIASGVFTESTGSSDAGFSPTYQRVLGYTIGAKKYIAGTGTDIKIEHSNSRMETTYPSIPIPGAGSFFPASPYYVSSVSLSISQPLLRNAWGLAKKNKLEISDYSLKLAGIKLSEDWEDFITILRDEYLAWQKCNMNVDLYKNKVKTVEDQLKLVKKQVRYGLSEAVDEVQIRQKLQAYKIMLEQAKMVCETQTQKISDLMIKGKSTPQDIKPEKFVKDESVVEEQAAIYYLDKDSNLRRTTDLMVSMQETDLETKKDKEKLEMNLVLQFKPNAFSHGFGDSLTQIGEYNETTLSINASRPLANDKARAEAEKAKSAYEKSVNERDEILLNAKTGLSALYTNFKYLTKMIELNRKNRKLARERLILEKKKFNQGRSSVFFILQAEDDVLAAENSLNEALFAREQIINQIKSLTDRYLVQYKDILKL
jgi:outer membrane protein TolC